MGYQLDEYGYLPPYIEADPSETGYPGWLQLPYKLRAILYDTLGQQLIHNLFIFFAISGSLLVVWAGWRWITRQISDPSTADKKTTAKPKRDFAKSERALDRSFSREDRKGGW